MLENYGVIGNYDLIQFYQRNDVIEIMRRYYNPEKIQPAEKTHAPRKPEKLKLTSFTW